MNLGELRYFSSEETVIVKGAFLSLAVELEVSPMQWCNRALVTGTPVAALFSPHSVDRPPTTTRSFSNLPTSASSLAGYRLAACPSRSLVLLSTA